ncbi:hypothetical protein DL89DRAFT_27672 [Linderina pennispora]|uniref:Uncharacterized protein n=1 Tax=Linderina pennispora TaxID=61395 RepID=A0A1Y1W3Z8_9FUNG|nr:uncharacterized protein DL89DRAFT_27672 [Linderina pennispora]ORX68178.1 hypothetical protein DL89DRAFT_27672 [Linderina pennispora]
MDLNSFRQQVLADTSVEERVEVNQRHLIDKILARYSTEYTFHRELLQNSNDAGASKVIITFHTAQAGATAGTSNGNAATGMAPAAVDDGSDGVEVVGAFPAAALQAEASQKARASELRAKYRGLTLAEQCTSISFKNNGRAFTAADWARLKSIASGNPGREQDRVLWRRLLQPVFGVRGALCGVGKRVHGVLLARRPAVYKED